MNKIYFPRVGLMVIIGFISGCCSWDYNKEDFEFTQGELSLMGAYKVGDTLYFESNLGDIDTITVVKFSEERHEGSRCFIQTEPWHNRHITIRHQPDDKWVGTSQSEGEEEQIIYQSLISVSKSPLDSIKRTGYSISFKMFTTLENALGSSPGEFIINEKIISDCYKVTHGYPERIVNPDDIELVYWTAKYGLTSYTSKAGETWLLKNLK